MSENIHRKRFRRELQEYTPPPVDEDFYQTVWNRIGQTERSTLHPAPGEFWDWLGNLCWRALPVCLLLALLAGGWVFFFPYDPAPGITWEEAVLMNEAGTSPEEILWLETLFFEPEGKVVL